MRCVSALCLSVIGAVSCVWVVGAADELSVKTLSSRPDMVSGGDALIEVRGASATRNGLAVSLNDRDVSAAFHLDAAKGAWIGLVEGMRDGANVIVARAGGRSARLAVKNFPITGPIVSGDHLKPFVCNTAQSGLGEPLDENCSAPTKIEYFYKSSTPPSASTNARDVERATFKPLPDPKSRPADVVTTTTSAGVTVPYIVRVESGTINRSIYRIAILDDAAGGATAAWAPGKGWNGRLLFTFGGGCGTNYNQGTNQATGALFDAALSRGYAHAISTQNVMQQHCNDNLSGEALMMIKEHFIERYAPPAWTMGFGGSGGSIQQLLIAQNFPGLLDGLLPSLTFPDSISVRAGVTDCRLLMNYYKTADANAWTKEKKDAVEGYSTGTCGAWDRSFIDVIVATNVKGCGIPAELAYDPVKNPKGARCTMWDTNVATFGRDPATGFARRSLDNVGVQYGLAALNSGALTKDEFIDLNVKVGGYDNDGAPRAERTSADLEGVRLAYAAGRLNSGVGGLGSLPILHYRSYNDPMGDIHDRFRDFSVRERLRKANGRVDNQVIWIYPNGVAGLGAKVTGLAIDTMAQWLDGLSKDASTGSAIDKIVRAKPAAAVDACWDGAGAKIEEPATFDGPGRCNTLYPSHKNPRLIAGAQLTDDVLKCQLKPLDPKDYTATFTADELQRLRTVFPGGVCDYSKRGVMQQPLAGTYLSLPLKSPTSTTTSASRP